MKIYLVGGAVRDRLLNIPVKDRDWLVIGATEQEMQEKGFIQADGQFPVFLHPESGEEYALARKETKTGTGYKGFSVECNSDVTLEEDLQRRDFTINALVEDDGEVIDRVGGLEDIEARRIRHITPAFVEDPVRLLRAARFTARLSKYGFALAHETFKLLQQMALSDEMAALKPERVWQEMSAALSEPEPWRFFEVLHRSGALGVLLPQLAEAMGNRDPSHDKQEESEPIRALKRAVAAGADPTLRFVALFYPVCQGPGGARWLTSAVPVERSYLEPLEQLQGIAIFYPKARQFDEEATLDILIRGRAQQQPERFSRLIESCRLIWPDRAEQFAGWIGNAEQAMGSVSPAQLAKEGLQGADLGRELRSRQLAAIRAVLSE